MRSMQAATHASHGGQEHRHRATRRGQVAAKKGAGWEKGAEGDPLASPHPSERCWRLEASKRHTLICIPLLPSHVNQPVRLKRHSHRVFHKIHSPPSHSHMNAAGSGPPGGMWRERVPAHTVNTDLAAKLDYHAGLLPRAHQRASSIQEVGEGAHEFSHSLRVVALQVAQPAPGAPQEDNLEGLSTGSLFKSLVRFPAALRENPQRRIL